MLNKQSNSPAINVVEPTITLQINKSLITKKLRKVQTRQKKACFLILGGLEMGGIITMDKPQMILGRDANCDFVLRDDGISRYHIGITRLGAHQVSVNDLGSTNGMFVDGEKVNEAILTDGDKILLGRRTVLKFSLQDELDESYQHQMYESSTRDGLTGIYNRKYFAQKLAADLSFACRHRVSFTLLLLDVDFFKKVNDTYGHRTGDDVLISVADTMLSVIRTEDTLARYGGEEFAILAPGTDSKGGHALAERIREAIANCAVVARNNTQEIVRVTASIGVATLRPGVRFNAEDLVSVADKNLYGAKNGGRNRTVASSIK
jgi:diguanylate cyclase (GGDEF)-like protein